MKEKNYNPIIYCMQNIASLSKQVINPGVNEDETEIVDALLKNIERFGKEYLNSLEIDSASKIPEQVLKKAAELGFFGITISPDYGGAGLSLKASCRLIEQLAYYDSSTATTIGLHAGLGMRGLNFFGSKYLQDKYLPEFASGKKIAAFAATESEAGSHISNVKTTAAGDDEKQILTINGSKIYVTNGGLADVFTILTTSPNLGGKKNGHTLILIPKETPGLSIGNEERKMGMKGSSTTSLFLDNVKIGYDHIIGEPGKGLDTIGEILLWGRILMSAGCLGVARTAFAKAIDHATTRVQFDSPIGKFGMIQSKISFIRQSIYIMESLIRSTTQNFHLGLDITFESCVTKVVCSERVWESSDETLQLFGGSGFIEDTGIAQLLRSSRITRIFEGTNDVLRLHIGIMALSWNRDNIANTDIMPGINNSLLPLSGLFISAKNDFAHILKFIKRKYGFSAANNQFVLKNAANSAISLYIMLSVLSYTNGLLESSIPEEFKNHYITICTSIINNESVKIEQIKLMFEKETPLWDEAIADFVYEQLLGKPL